MFAFATFFLFAFPALMFSAFALTHLFDQKNTGAGQ
jgi:hypothetical protein